MKYEYFIAYSFGSLHTNGVSNCTYSTDTPISSLARVQEIEKQIRDERHGPSFKVVLMSWQKFDTAEPN